MRVSAETSRKIENMSFLCAILVVTIHVGWSDQIGSFGWWMKQLVKGGVAQIAVPFFFVVSGYFLSAHFEEMGWWPRETRKRFWSLVVPFLLWIVIHLVSGWPLSIVADLIAHRPFGTSIYFPVDNIARTFGFDLAYYPHLVPLWYVRCLFIFVMISPVIKWFVEKIPYAWLLLLFAGSTAILFCRGWFYSGAETGCPLSYLTLGVSIAGTFYFSLGMLIRKMGWNKTSRMWAIGCLGLGLELIIFNTALLYNGTPSIPLPYIPFVLYGIWHFMPTTPLPVVLRGCTFPIYLMHIIVFGYVGFVLSKLSIELDDTTRSVTLVAVGVIIPIVFCNVLRKCCPRVARVLFCGRV